MTFNRSLFALGLYYSGSEQRPKQNKRPMVGFCWNGNELSGSTRSEELIATSWDINFSRTTLLYEHISAKVGSGKEWWQTPPTHLPTTYHPCVFHPKPTRCHLCCGYRVVYRYCDLAFLLEVHTEVRWRNSLSTWTSTIHVYSFSDPGAAVTQFFQFRVTSSPFGPNILLRHAFQVTCWFQRQSE